MKYLSSFWSSAKRKSTALSSIKAEYIALSDCVKELCWLLRITHNFSFLNLITSKPVIHCDNQSTITFSKNHLENNRTKYIATRFYYIKENLEKFILKYVSGDRNVADVFIKPLQ